MYTAFVDK